MIRLLPGMKPKRDPSFGDPLAKRVLADAEQGNIQAALDAVTPVRTGQWNDRAFYLWLISSKLPDTVDDSMIPDTALGNTLKGIRAMSRAQKSRGTGLGNTVTEEGWKGFVHHEDLAAQHLFRAGEQDVEDPTPYARLVSVAMGLQLERRVSDQWFEEAIRRDPLNSAAHRARLTLLCEKWGGSHDEMYAFARETIRRIPPESVLNSILYNAFYEYFLYYRSIDSQPKYVQGLLSNSMVRQESLEIYTKSLKKHSRVEQVSDFWAHNMAAWWFFVLDIPEPVREETRKIGPYYTEIPWHLYKDPAETYEQASRM